MQINAISPFYGAKLFQPTSQTTRPSPNAQDEINLKFLDQTKKSYNLLRSNYLKR